MDLADGEDLLDVVLAVDEMEPTPLCDVEGTENCVGRAVTGGTEESLRFVEEQVEMVEVVDGSMGQVFA
jgi:hypothetical protein